MLMEHLKFFIQPSNVKRTKPTTAWPVTLALWSQSQPPVVRTLVASHTVALSKLKAIQPISASSTIDPSPFSAFPQCLRRWSPRWLTISLPPKHRKTVSMTYKT